MSYCRWSECEVYAYDAEEGVWFHVSCNKGLDRLCNTYNEAYQYAKELRDIHGLDVPQHAIDALRDDAIDEAALRFGPNRAVSELKSENAKLRSLLSDVCAASSCERGECPLFVADGEPCRMAGVG